MLREERDVTKVTLLWRAGPDGDKLGAPFLEGTAQVMIVGPGSPPPQASRPGHRPLTVKTETETPRLVIFLIPGLLRKRLQPPSCARSGGRSHAAFEAEATWEALLEKHTPGHVSEAGLWLTQLCVPLAAASGMFRFPSPRGRRKETKSELPFLTAGEQLKKLPRSIKENLEIGVSDDRLHQDEEATLESRSKRGP